MKVRELIERLLVHDDDDQVDVIMGDLIVIRRDGEWIEVPLESPLPYREQPTLETPRGPGDPRDPGDQNGNVDNISRVEF